MAWQTADVVDAITAAADIPSPSCGSTAAPSVMDVLCQFQADVLGVTVRRPVESRDHRARRRVPRRHRRGRVAVTRRGGARPGARRRRSRPQPLPHGEQRRADWRKALDRSRNWVDPDEP